ncbi:MAG: phage replisome organizer N-terminal domain-containing protein [Halarcobacter sp.]
MSNNKKFFWLKLKNDFFDREEIKIIENQQNGKDYIIFYMKLLLKSVESEGQLFFRNTIAYSPDMLATITNTSSDTVKVAVDLFIKLKLMERWDDGTLFMIETQNMVGSETKWAELKRNQRAKSEQIGHCPMNVKKSPIEIEKELKQEIETEDYSNWDALICMHEVEKEKKKKSRSYTQKPRTTKSTALDTA